MRKRLLIFGTGLMSDVLASLIEQEQGRRVDAFTVDAAYCDKATHLGAPLIPFEDVVTACPPEDYDFLVAVGYAELNALRGERAAALTRAGYTPASFISTAARVASNAVLGPGCVLFEHVVVHPYARLGCNVVIWPHAYVGHHSTVGDNVFVGGNAVINGGVTIGRHTLVGAGAVVRDFVSVGERCIIGAGSVLLRHLPSEALCHCGESAVILDKTPTMRLWPPKVERS